MALFAEEGILGLIMIFIYSLLKVHMTLRGFSVFIDVERLEAGKFDNNLLNSIQQAKTFLLVLTPNALDRCVGDDECKDWVHKVTVLLISASLTNTLAAAHFESSLCAQLGTYSFHTRRNPPRCLTP